MSHGRGAVGPRRRWRAALAVLAGLALAGCAQVGYLAQSVGGHLQVLQAARPVSDWLADPATPEPLRQRLQLSQQMRDFASAELRLPDNASYRRYAELGRASVVWNVVAAPELGLQLQTWCYPVVGCVGYRGYYAQADAEQAAAPLRAQGLEVQVYGVPAYSTLGKLPGRWFADPLLNTFLNVPEADLARLIFHELAHQVAYAAGDTVFNESFATAVERLGGERWLDAHGGAAARAAVAAQDRRREEFRAFVLGVRDRLQAVYAGPGRDDEKRAAKAQVLATMRTDYEQLKRERWGGFSGYDAWFARANNASFAILGAYHGLAPNFERLFAREGGDFERFYAEVRRLAALPAATRRSEIEALAR